MRGDIRRPAGNTTRWLAALAVAVAVSCGGDGDVGSRGGLVGGRCMADRDCSHRCLMGGDFPGGYCSLACSTDADCPGGTVCIEKEGGVCLLKCDLPADCASLGDGYGCKGKKRKGIADAEALVCIAD